MAQQKLYTEEQVKQIFENLSTSTGYDYNMETYCNSITPIELPSDEEILEATPYTPVDANSYKLGLKYGFRDGAHWMKEQILNQNK
jgi:hypothetical protein